MQKAEVNIKELVAVIQELKNNAKYLADISGGMQCVDRNSDRILASVKMLELNISDVADLVDEE